MESSTKKIVGTLAVMAAIGGGFYLYTKGKKLLSGAKMNFALLGFRIHKITLQEVQFAVKLRCYNPTNSAITLAINQVIAKYKGSAIAYSTPDIKGLTVQAGKSQDAEITFQVPILNLLGKGLTTALLQDTEQIKADMSFTLTLSINGETITTTQNLIQENMNGLASGELGIVSGPRNTQDGRQFNNLIKRATGANTFIKNGNVLETVESCIDIIANHYREVEDLAKNLKADSLKNTCRNIFNFAYTYLQYQKDEDGTEQLRTPARSWMDGQIKFKQQGDINAGIDCDDYSIFVGSLLRCLGIPFKVRITKYDGRSYFQHIYVFVPAQGDSEDEIIIDPVLSKFDYQKPYSFEKSDFDMSPLQKIGGIHGINGLTGTLGLGLPIYALSGFDADNNQIEDTDHTELMAIVSGVDFEESINGLGNAEDATLAYLIRTRDYLLKNQSNKSKMAHIQNPDQFIDMLDQVIKYWNTPQRQKVLDKLVAIEDKLAENGLIKYDIDGIEGFDEMDEMDEEEAATAGLGRSRRRKKHKKKRKGRFFKAIKKIGKKVGKAAKKAVKAVVRFNPLSIAIRNGLLAALRINMFGISKKLQYAYLPDNLAAKYNIDKRKLADLKKRHKKVRKLFHGLQGKDKNLRNAILKGAKQKSRDFSLKGVQDVIAGLQGLESVGELAQLGDLGVAATAASVTAAAGVLAKIKSWLKPVSNIFSTIKNKIKSKKNKVSTRTRNTKKVVTPQQTSKATPTTKSVSTATDDYTTDDTTDEDTKTSIIPSSTTSQVTTTQTSNVTKSTSKSISKKAKLGIAVGLAAIVGTGAYFMFRKKSGKSTTHKKRSSRKNTLGKIELS